MNTSEAIMNAPWAPVSIAAISREVCVIMRTQYIDLKNKIRHIDLMRECARKRKDYENIRYLNADRVMVLQELRELIKDYRYAWSRAVGV
jgi:hypothetical protein